MSQSKVSFRGHDKTFSEWFNHYARCQHVLCLYTPAQTSYCQISYRSQSGGRAVVAHLATALLSLRNNDVEHFSVHLGAIWTASSVKWLFTLNFTSKDDGIW